MEKEIRMSTVKELYYQHLKVKQDTGQSDRFADMYIEQLEYELAEVARFNSGLADEIREKDRKILELTTSRGGIMSLSEAIRRMEENPGLKMCMPRHYRSWQYNYYDKKKGYHCIETGEM